MCLRIILTFIFALVAILYSQSTECLSITETYPKSPDSLKRLTVFERQAGLGIKRVFLYDFSTTSASAHVGPMPKVVTNPAEFSPLLPKVGCSAIASSMYCKTTRSDSTLLFSRDQQNLILFATSFKDIKGWNGLWDINTSDTPGMRFDYCVNSTAAFRSVTRQSHARLKLTGINTGDEVTFVVTGHLTLCMCGGMVIGFGGNYNFSLIDTTSDARGNAVLRHVFQPEDQGSVDFSISGAEHNMSGYISSLLIFRSGRVPTHAVVSPVAPQNDDHPSFRRNVYNLNGQRIGDGRCSVLKVVNSRTVVDVK